MPVSHLILYGGGAAVSRAGAVFGCGAKPYAAAGSRSRSGGPAPLIAGLGQQVGDDPVDKGVDLRRVVSIPFLINFPERCEYYLPPGTIQFIRMFSNWERKKGQRLQVAAGTGARWGRQVSPG